MAKAYVFTVVDGEDNGCSVVYAEMASERMKNDQAVAVEAIKRWIDQNVEVDEGGVNEMYKECREKQIAEAAYCMRKNGWGWYNGVPGAVCSVSFNLTELVG